MSITTKEINALRELTTRTRRGCGNGLLIVRDPRGKNGFLQKIFVRKKVFKKKAFIRNPGFMTGGPITHGMS